jgi:hypothetical protein
MHATERVALLKGKGAAEYRDGLVARVLGSAKQADRVQRHLDAVLAERGTAKATPDAKVIESGVLDI